MTHDTATNRRAAKAGDGEGEAYWFYGDKAVLRSPAGVRPVIIEHHVGRVPARRCTCITTSTTASTCSAAAGDAVR